MKIILALFVSLGLCFSMVAFAAEKPTTVDGKKYSCGCTKSKHKSKTENDES